MAGLHVPLMPLVEVVGNAGTLAPLQYGPTAANVGVVGVFTVSVMVLEFVVLEVIIPNCIFGRLELVVPVA